MSYSARIRRRRGGGRGKYFLLGFVVVLASAGLAVAAAVGWVLRTASSAPPLSSLKQRDPGQITEVLAADGTRLGFIQADDLRQPVASEDLPKNLRDATVAIEDERFFKHKGVDYEGIVRAAVKNLKSHKTVQGGSTLTMQLVRNLYPYQGSRTREGLAGYQRKIKEARLAEELEDTHSKNWVLSKYINTVPYGTVGGQTAVGAGAAARIYFNKRVQDLTLRQAAMIAGMPQAPSDYSPVLAPERTLARRNEVLRKMAELHMITPETYRKNAALGLGLHMEGYYRQRRESYFFDYVKDELIKEYGAATVKLGGLRVRTTVDLKKQQEARAAIKARLAGVGPSSAIVSIDPRNGDIVAMASSADYGKSKFNLAAQGHRQPGSSFKVMALMTALREGVDPDTTHYVSRSPTRIDAPQCGAPFEIKTYGGKGAGDLTLHRATLKSDNSVYIQLAADLGPDKVKETARMMGIKSPLYGYCAETLGGLTKGVSPLEMADAYATIASGGYRNRPRAITRVYFPDGHSELPKRWRIHRVKAFEDGVTYEATTILQDNIKGGTGTRAAIGCPAAGKTGTTDHNTDAWFVGFTPRLATAVWVGYPGSRIEMNALYNGGPVDGGTFPAEIWGLYMKQAIGKYCGDFPKPKQPFVRQPFFGHYATTGRKEPGNSTGDQTGTADQQGNGGANDQGGGDGKKPGAYDPNKYESPPQGPPKTKGRGNDNGTPGGGTQAPGDDKQPGNG